MKLEIDLKPLFACVEQMGASLVDGPDIKPLPPIPPIKPTESEVILDEVKPDGNGLLTYRGEQVLLYIKDHGFGVLNALEDGEKGRRFHVAECTTLQNMRQLGRHERYHVTSNRSGIFPISGNDPETGDAVTGETQLMVCKNCLKQLDYKGYDSKGGTSRATIWRSFSIEQFFEHYRSRFEKLPHRRAEDDASYPPDWDRISEAARTRRDYRCEQCGVDLSTHRHLLHTHHIDGVKSNNADSNLKVLCVDCHRQQPLHKHMRVDDNSLRLIQSLRSA